MKKSNISLNESVEPSLKAVHMSLCDLELEQTKIMTIFFKATIQVL